MKFFSPTTCRLILATALAYAVLPVTARAQASAHARLDNNLSGSGHVGGIATPVGSGLPFQEARLESIAADGTMNALGFGNAGVVGAHAQIRYASSNFNSGGLNAIASGSWSDVIDLVIPNRFVLPDVSFFRLDYDAETHGGVAATGMFSPNGHALVASSANISYDFTFGSNRFLGSQRDDFLNGASTTGIWGAINGTAQVAAGGSISMIMAGSATASLGNFFNFGPRTASVEADFGSTLIWGGITHVTAFNVSGQVLDLPDDFQLDLIGRQSGFNYWNAAVDPNAAPGVPESAPAMLMLAPALLGLALIHRRRHRVAFGS